MPQLQVVSGPMSCKASTFWDCRSVRWKTPLWSEQVASGWTLDVLAPHSQLIGFGRKWNYTIWPIIKGDSCCLSEQNWGSAIPPSTNTLGAIVYGKTWIRSNEPDPILWSNQGVETGINLSETGTVIWKESKRPGDGDSTAGNTNFRTYRIVREIL